MKHAKLKLLSLVVPYFAVLTGLYLLKNAWITIALYHLSIAIFIIVGDRKGILKKAGTGWNLPIAVLSMLLAAIIIPVVLLLWQYMQLDNISLNSSLAGLGLKGNSWFFFAIYFSTVQPVLEELYWRGYLICSNKFFSWPDVAFAAYHILVLALFIKWQWLIISFFALALTAYVWRYLANKLQGLIVPLLSHIAADISIIIVTYVLIQ